MRTMALSRSGLTSEESLCSACFTPRGLAVHSLLHSSSLTLDSSKVLDSFSTLGFRLSLTSLCGVIRDRIQAHLSTTLRCYLLHGKAYVPEGPTPIRVQGAALEGGSQ